MRTSLNEIKLIDEHLFGTSNTGDALLFDAMLILDNTLSEKVEWQKNTHTLIQQYGRKKLKAEIDEVHQKLFNEPPHRHFAQKIRNLFLNR
ncbi:hypothetical protein JN11_04742 [Mucilaginibacter frigoritolerans]|uniref:Uncharacterized protein n=1 Tax=Mucilaginibacter frigoritolerans TaxID=652788 RepID=A0A562TLA7_9SPHI|nr:hypothetical protein [Mucilaginibacter frigoritolerans]TWI94351.1 hypothetical protein JN11_04742 [Mucilaginibacter frigoritolerans]